MRLAGIDSDLATSDLDFAGRGAPRAQPVTLTQCLVLALLLHLLVVVVFGNAPGGTARRGEGVWGALDITLGGHVPDARDGTSSSPLPYSGPLGQAPQWRWGGAVRDPSPEAPKEPGAARLGVWNTVPTPAPAAESPAPTTRPVPARPVPRKSKVESPPPVLSRSTPAAAAPPRVLPVPAAEAPPTPEPPAPAVEAPPPEVPLPPTPPAPSTAPRPAVSEQAPATRVDRGRDLPTAAVPPLPEPVPERQQPSAPPRAPDLAPRVDEARPAAPAALEPAPVQAIPAPPLPEARPEPPAPPLPTPPPPLPAPAPVPIEPPATPTPVVVPPIAPAAAPPPPTVAEPPPTPPLPPVQEVTPSRPAAVPATPAVAPDPQPAPQPLAPAPAPAAVAPGVPAPSAGTPDAGSRVGHDVATAPSAASAPRLNLEMPRTRGGPIANTAPRGLLLVLPQPPERRSKLGEALEKSVKPDCRDAYKGMGLLAVVPLAADALRSSGGCRW